MLAFFLFLALRQKKNVTSLFRYHLYGDDLRENRFTGSLISTNASLSGAFVLIIYYGFLYGPWAFPFVWLFWVITERTSAWTIDRTEAVLKKSGGWFKTRITLHEFLGLSFQSPRARLYAGSLSLLSYLGLIAAEIVLSTHLLRYMFQLDSAHISSSFPLSAFLVIVAVMFSILIYNFLSGFRGTVQTDFAQWMIMSVMIVIVAAFVVAKSPLWMSKYGTIFNSPSNTPLVATFFNPDRQGYIPYLSFLVSNIIFWGLWWPGAMDQWQRCAAARSPGISLNRTWGTIGSVPVLYFGALTAAFLGVGVWLRVNAPDAAPSPDFLRIVVADVHQWGTASFGTAAGMILAAFTFWGLICAAMSTLDSYVMTASQTFFVDMAQYRTRTTLVELDGSDGNREFFSQARRYTLYIPFLVIVMALLFFLASDVYGLIYFSFSMMFALLPPLFAALKGWASPRARLACEYSLLSGGLTALIGAIVIMTGLEHALKTSNPAASFWWYQAVYWWSTVVCAVGAVVLWLTWPSSLPSKRDQS
jgi:Na+/proline symporter